MRDFNIDDHPRSAQFQAKSFMDALGNVFVLNIFFVIFSIPLITIGASLTALFSVCLKLINKEEPHLWQAFVSSFKSNFKNATIVWLILIGAFGVLWADNMLIYTVEGPLATFYTFVKIFEIVLLAIIVPFLFPLMARFENTIGNYFKNSFLLAIGNLWNYIKFSLIWFVPVLVTVKYPVVFVSTWYLWLILLFGTMAYLSSKVVNNIFTRVEEAKVEEKKQIDDKNLKRSQMLKVHKKATSYVNPATDDEEEDEAESSLVKESENDTDIKRSEETTES